MEPRSSEIRTGKVALAAVTLAFREVGAPGGVPILLLHALGSSAGTWDAFAGRLAASGRHVLALDLRGHGDSSWTEEYSLGLMFEDVQAFLDDRGFARTDVVGHSMGGAVAVLLAQRQPERVRRLVIEDTPPLPEIPSAKPPVEVTEPTAPLPFDWRVIEPVITEFRAPDRRWWSALQEITAPTLLIGGGPTSHVPPEDLTRVSEAIPDCRLAFVEDAGHRVHSTKPADFWALAGPFLNT